MLLCTKWIITREQIKIYQGVLSKRINYIELYRVYDYEEKQSFIQSLKTTPISTFILAINNTRTTDEWS